MELRYGTASTVFCTQLKKKDWHPRLGGGVHADAIMDRIGTVKILSQIDRGGLGPALL